MQQQIMFFMLNIKQPPDNYIDKESALQLFKVFYS